MHVFSSLIISMNTNFVCVFDLYLLYIYNYITCTLKYTDRHGAGRHRPSVTCEYLVIAYNRIKIKTTPACLYN